MVLCNATLSISKYYDSRLTAERPLTISVNTTKLCFVVFRYLKITRIYSYCFFFLFLYLRQKRKCQNRNTELANGLWQCYISEVWVTLGKGWVCGWKNKPHFESGTQNNPNRLKVNTFNFFDSAKSSQDSGSVRWEEMLKGQQPQGLKKGM